MKLLNMRSGTLFTKPVLKYDVDRQSITTRRDQLPKLIAIKKCLQKLLCILKEKPETEDTYDDIVEWILIYRKKWEL